MLVGTVRSIAAARTPIVEAITLSQRHLLRAVLTRPRASVPLAHAPDFDAFEQELQSPPVHLTRVNTARVGEEPPLLKTHRPHAQPRAVEVQHLDLRGPAVDESVQIAAQWIALHP